jgi:CelD/BcsL family acetyltransferase involved in cellulose biosynthesis
VQRSIASGLNGETSKTSVPLILSGIPISGAVPKSLVAALVGQHEIRAVDMTERFVASLTGGLDGWLGRRSPSLRRNLRAAARRARDAGLAFERHRVSDEDTARALYERVLEIERTSWKSMEGAGADTEPMRTFYADMLPRLAATGRLHVLFATLGERDVGYLHGGSLDDHFRGLQMSFDARCADLSIGNLLQREMISILCEEGFTAYDLGSKPGYKERWSEPGLATMTLVCRPRH